MASQAASGSTSALAGKDTSAGRDRSTRSVQLTPAQEAERLRRQRMRSIAIAVSLALLVGLFYAATIVRLGGNVLNRSL